MAAGDIKLNRDPDMDVNRLRCWRYEVEGVSEDSNIVGFSYGTKTQAYERAEPVSKRLREAGKMAPKKVYQPARAPERVI